MGFYSRSQFFIESIFKTLLEGRKEDAIQKYPNVEQFIDKLVETDPTRSSLKYILWQSKMLSQGADIDDVIAVASLFEKFGRKLHKKDINSYSFKELRDLLDTLKELEKDSTEKKAKKSDDSSLARCEQELVYEDKDFIIRHIAGKNASVHYGRGTKWCITMANEQYFESYTSANSIFFFLIKRKPIGDAYDKIAFCFDRDEEDNVTDCSIFNSADDKISESLAEKSIGPIFQKLYAYMEVRAKIYAPSILALIKRKNTPAEVLLKYYDELIVSEKEKVESTIFSIFIAILNKRNGVPVEIINDIISRIFSDNIHFEHWEAEQLLFAAADHQNLSEQSIALIYRHKLNAFKYMRMQERDEDNLRNVLFQENFPPQSLYEEILNNMIEINKEPAYWELNFIRKIPNIPDEMQFELVKKYSYSLKFLSSFALREQQIPANVTNFIIDLLLEEYEETQDKDYFKVIQKFLIRQDLTDYAATKAGHALYPRIKPT